MSRYLIIDTKKLDQLFSRSDNFETFMGYILSEEETLSKFKEVWDAADQMDMKEEGWEGYEDAVKWSEFSKTL